MLKPLFVFVHKEILLVKSLSRRLFPWTPAFESISLPLLKQINQNKPRKTNFSMRVSISFVNTCIFFLATAYFNDALPIPQETSDAVATTEQPSVAKWVIGSIFFCSSNNHSEVNKNPSKLLVLQTFSASIYLTFKPKQGVSLRLSISFTLPKKQVHLHQKHLSSSRRSARL